MSLPCTYPSWNFQGSLGRRGCSWVLGCAICYKAQHNTLVSHTEPAPTSLSFSWTAFSWWRVCTQRHSPLTRLRCAARLIARWHASGHGFASFSSRAGKWASYFRYVVSSRILRRHSAVVNMLIACPFRYEQTFPGNCTSVDLLLTQPDFMVPDSRCSTLVILKPRLRTGAASRAASRPNHLTIYKYFHSADTVHGTISITINRTNIKGTRCILHMLANYPTYFDTPHVISSGSLCGCYHNAFETFCFVLNTLSMSNGI